MPFTDMTVDATRLVGGGRGVSGECVHDERPFLSASRGNTRVQLLRTKLVGWEMEVPWT